MKILENEQVVGLGDFIVIKKKKEEGIHSVVSKSESVINRGEIVSSLSKDLGLSNGHQVIYLESAAIDLGNDLVIVHKDHVIATIIS